MSHLLAPCIKGDMVAIQIQIPKDV